MILFVLLFFAGFPSPAQEKNNSDKILEVFRDNANMFLRKKVEADLGEPQDDIRKALKVSYLERYRAEVRNVHTRLADSVMNGKVPKKREEIIQLAFSEYKKFVPDLKQEFYDKSLVDIRNLVD